MDEVKQVKVDNWGVYFLQRLKHFFNRTDYCDLTLQFQDNAQLKVHRLVLSACTEYFELLERTCEMYEDCLVMPDDLQADVVVPIVNFMYTGQLEFRMDLLESLLQTSQIMNMPVLTKLLDAHRHQQAAPKPVHFSTPKRCYSKSNDPLKSKQAAAGPSSSSSSYKRSFNKAFPNVASMPTKKIHPLAPKKSEPPVNDSAPYPTSSPISLSSAIPTKKTRLSEPRPTRYELPEELDTDNIFDNSFTNISYTSQPLMVHPDSTKQYVLKRSGILAETSSSKKLGSATGDIVECKKITRNDNIFEDTAPEEPDMYESAHLDVKEEPVSNRLFDQILDRQGGPKVTIETKDSKQANNIDHAKIISEVLKKYPHLVKSNKNIKLKILNTPGNPPTQQKKHINSQARMQYHEDIVKEETPDYTYETDVLDSKEAARLIALGAENIKGPWICLICGTPGRALHFTSYYKFRRHLVEVHNEKPVSKMCEYCGLKSLKRNYLLHHQYTKHGIEPPPSYRFPKCNLCNYVALTEGFLVKHKLTHSESINFRCNVCAASYNTSSQLLTHIQNTGHKYSAERKTNLQCIYCLKVFLRESNLYAHLKTNHKHAAKSDGIIDESDEELQEQLVTVTRKPEVRPPVVKYEPQNFDTEYEDVETQYQIQQRPDGNIHLISKKQQVITSTPTKQKILNSGLNTPKSQHKPKSAEKVTNVGFHEYNMRDVTISPKKQQDEEIVVIDNDEYIMRNNQLILRRKMSNNEEYIMSDMVSEEADHSLTAAAPTEMTNLHHITPGENMQQQQKMIVKKSANINQPIQIVVSNEEEYKALMNSNHSIIFDNGDANKTLTVLSTPHSNTLNTTPIDLNNTQSNDMMIIQDNYPINVSQALPADNSNIVVVYSHPVDDQNKQYQLIASQDIGAQFVQSSAVISQNYGTISTSTPVMSAHVIEAQVTESWQNNIPENAIHTSQAQIAAAAELQGMSVLNRMEMTSAENETISLNDLPEVTLTSNVTFEVPTQEKEAEEQNETDQQEKEAEEGMETEEQEKEPEEDNLDQPKNINNEIVTENLEEVVEEDVQVVSLLPMSMDVTSELTSADVSETGKPSDMIAPNEILSQSDINIETSNDNLLDKSCIVEEGIVEPIDEPDQEVDEACIVEQGIEEPTNEQIDETGEPCIVEQETEEEVTEELVEGRDESDVIEQEIVDHSEERNEEIQDTDLNADANNLEQNGDAQITSINQEVTLAKVVTHKIQTLASEWSEDEEETKVQGQIASEASEASLTCDSKNITNESSVELEESIENIQQEMEKQMTDAPEADGETVDSLNSSQEENSTNLQEQPQTNVNLEAPREKISSLLNDWEDNDSQEQKDTINVKDDVPANDETTEKETEDVEQPEQKKDDKIKSLVSDWDDDDEENKS